MIGFVSTADEAVSHLLQAGDLAVDVVPACGGGIARFGFAGQPVFQRHPLGEQGVRGVEDLACYPLVPYSNRIAHGRLPSPRGDVAIAPLPGMGPHPIHGVGWRRPWTVDEASRDAIAMSHAHRADSHWPFDFEARQSLRVSPDALEMSIAVTNRSGEAMPAGIGLHPFFPSTPRASLATEVADWWLADADVLPTRREPVPSHVDFSAGRVLAETQLDNCFGGWSRRATLAWPERGLALDIAASDAFGTLVVYTPGHREFFCVEPVSHLNNGFQLAQSGVADAGARLLAPGASLEGTVRFAPRAA
jgi:aldose 1-epimerase